MTIAEREEVNQLKVLDIDDDQAMILQTIA
jgi:hypothetical protein